MGNDCLQHYGVLGMRWGVRRFQRKDGTRTPAGKKRRLERDRVETPDEKNKREEVIKKQHETDKQRAIRSGNATEVLKFKGEFSQQEMKYIKERIDWERNMSDISDAEIAAGKNKTEKIIRGMNSATDNAVSAFKTYNMIANVYNAFNRRGAVLPKVDTNITSGNKDAHNAWKREKNKRQKA